MNNTNFLEKLYNHYKPIFNILFYILLILIVNIEVADIKK
jgi:hypothetical protein